MTYAAKVLADSIAQGVRLTTMEVTFPRFILAEMNTHRVFSRNSASSRAIPVEKRIQQVQANPFVPLAFGQNRPGMQALGMVEGQAHARATWLAAAKDAVEKASWLADLGVHKQHANRLLEPFAWHTAVISATEWANFFALRCHPAAQPEMQEIANLMRDAYQASIPAPMREGQWHLPYVDSWDGPEGLRLSVVRCAAVSYERQDANRTREQVKERHDMLAKSGHWSPFEHQATPTHWANGSFVGNFRAPWVQYRKMFAGESIFSPDPT